MTTIATGPGALIGRFNTVEAARAAILARNPRFAEVDFQIDPDGHDAADMAIATRMEMRLFTIERQT